MQYRANTHAHSGRVCPLCGYGIHPRSKRPICQPCWEGKREPVPNAAARVYGARGWEANFKGLTPEEVSAEQSRRRRLARPTSEQRAATREKKQATWRARRVAFLQAEAEAEGRPRGRT